MALGTGKSRLKLRPARATEHRLRYKRQKRTTVMLRVPQGSSNTVLWPEFVDLNRALTEHLQSITTRIIRDGIHADTSEAEEVPAMLTGA